MEAAGAGRLPGRRAGGGGFAPLDGVLGRRLVALDQLRDGSSRALRTVLEAWSGDALPAGVAEMRMVPALLAAGLPQPVRQYEIPVDGLLVARVDLACPDDLLAMELDGFGWHAGRGPSRSGRLRRIEAAGRRLPEDVDVLVGDAAAIVRRAA